MRRLVLLVGLLALIGSPFGVSDAVHALFHAMHEHDAEATDATSLSCSSDCTDDDHHHHPPREQRPSTCPLCTPLAASMAAVIPPGVGPSVTLAPVAVVPVATAPRIESREHGVHHGRAPPSPWIDHRV